MSNLLSRLFRDHAVGMVYGLAMAMLYALAFYHDYDCDLTHHIWHLRVHLEAGKLPMPPLYYATVRFLDLIQPLGPHLGAVIALGAAAFLKFELLRAPLLIATNRALIAAATTWGLLLAAPLWIGTGDGNWYLGTLSTAVVQNSTTLFVLPAAIWLHQLSAGYLLTGSTRALMLMMLAGLLVVLSKPSYLFAQLPALALVLVLERGRLRSFAPSLLMYMTAMGAGILLLYAAIYSYGQLDTLIYGSAERARVVIAPMQVWRGWTSTPGLHALVSLPFVGLFFLRDPDSLRRSLSLRFSTWVFVVAVVIFVLFAETGVRALHGNFYWQIPIALLLLHFTMLVDLAEQRWPPLRGKFTGLSLKDKLLLLAAVLHVIAGIAYLLRFAFTGKYI